MKLVFREDAKRDLRWFSKYYALNFPEGRKQAELRFAAAIKLVLDNPRAGNRIEGLVVRKMAVQRTPFVLIYAITGDTIDIIRVWDARADPIRFSER
jgi:plasmid stabilization system protein ParE